MAMQKLQDAQWKEYFNRVSRAASGMSVEVDISGLSGTPMIEAHNLPLTGITYDAKDDLVDIAVGTLGNIIEHPREVYVDYQDDGLHAIEVVDAEGNHEILKLNKPLLVIAPH